MRSSLESSLFFVGLLTSILFSVRCQELLGGEEEEIYGDDYEEEFIEDPSVLSYNPQFTSLSKHVKVDLGGTIRLPCQVDKLGPMVISWMKAGEHGENPKYFASGRVLFNTNTNRIRLEDVNDQGSTLVITLASEDDVGEYICEVSSKPPARLRHQVSIIISPTVEIIKPQNEDHIIRVQRGQEVALICTGSGDPEPKYRWFRQTMRLPDGRDYVDGQQLIFKNVTRKHSGNYVCEGWNGSGASARDTVQVDVLHAPEISLEESYIRLDNSVKLELSCLVHASPQPKVKWFKDGQDLRELPDISLSVNGGKQFLLIISNVSMQHVGMYTCHASNNIGEAKARIRVVDPNIIKHEKLPNEVKKLEFSSSSSSSAAALSLLSSLLWCKSLSLTIPFTVRFFLYH